MTDSVLAASVIAAVAGVVGFFVVVRGSTFAAHALPMGAFPGATAAGLLGINPLLGMVLFAVTGALGIGRLAQRERNDVATALVLVVLLGLGELLASLSNSYGPEVSSLLFGEVFGVNQSELLPVGSLAAVAIIAMVLAYRPLLLNSVSSDLGEVQGISSKRMEMTLLLVMALVASMALPVVGALLVFSLMVGPPSVARTIVDRPDVAMAASGAISLVTVWAAIGLSYETGWPIGFFVGTLGAVSYGLGRIIEAGRNRRRGRHQAMADSVSIS